MSKNNKVVKYKVINTNIDKKFIGKDLDLQKVKSKGGSGSDGGRKPGSTNKITLTKLSNKVDTLANNLNAVANNLDAVTNNLDNLAKIVTDGFAEQAKFNKQQLEFNTRMEKEVSNLRSDFDRVIKLNNLKH